MKISMLLSSGLDRRDNFGVATLLIIGVASACAAQTDGGESANADKSAATGGAANSVAVSSGGNVDATLGGSSTKTSTGGSSQSDGTAPLSCQTPEEKSFSFFLASNAALIRLSGSADGFGGDLGGLEGADAICQAIAEHSSPCQTTRVWRAFLSTTSVNAKDRIGAGPWYDRRGRLLAANLANLLNERPVGADAAIVNDFPNEDGVPNHNPDGTKMVDNHQILTGSGTDGNVYTQSATPTPFPGGGGQVIPGSTSCGPNNGPWSVEAATCWGWTTSEGKGCPRVGHSWPRQVSGMHWISVFNEGGCAPGGALEEPGDIPVGLDGTPRVGSAGGYGGFYCFAVAGT